MSIEQFLATWFTKITIQWRDDKPHIMAALEELHADGDTLIAVGTGKTVQDALDRLMVEFKKATIDR